MAEKDHESVRLEVLGSLQKVVPVFVLNKRGNGAMVPFVQIVQMILEKRKRKPTSKLKKKMATLAHDQVLNTRAFLKLPRDRGHVVKFVQ